MMRASFTVAVKFSRVLLKPKMAVVAEGLFLALLFEEVEDATASLRELNPRFEDEGVETTGSDTGVETTSSGTGAGVWVPSCVPRKACVPLVIWCTRASMAAICGHPLLANGRYFFLF
jgi:hypothetical protein